jgi:hypothetical protein
MNKEIIGLIGDIDIGTKIDIKDELFEIINTESDPLTLQDVLYLDRNISNNEESIYLIQVMYEREPILCIGTVKGDRIIIEEYVTIPDLVNSKRSKT